MALHAVQNVDDAFDATREFLLPFDLRRWLKLALVAFFVGGGMNLPTSGANTSTQPEQVPDQAVPPVLPDNVWLIVGAVVGLIVVLALLWGLISAIMEFVFVESLRRDTVALRTYWSERWRQGVRLFVFRIVLVLPLLALIVGWLAAVFGPLLTGVGSPALLFGAFLVGIPLFFLLGILYGLVDGFTTVFVVPIMILDDCGVIAAWRRLWASITAEWKQYLAYAVAGVVLSFAGGILSSIVLGLVAVIVLLPLAVVGLLVHVAIGLSSTVGFVLLALLAVIFVVVMVAVSAVVQVPILVYLRYYALLVLGDIDESLDLIPDRRERIRSEA